MATVAQVAKASLQLILVQASEADLEAAEYSDYILSLNNFMAALEADNVILGSGWTPVDDLSDTLAVPDGALEAIIYNMAVRVAPMYNGKVTDALITSAIDSMKTLRNLGQSVASTAFSYTLPIGSGNEIGLDWTEHFYDGDTSVGGSSGPFLTRADINTILELNTIVADATIMVAGDNISNFVNDSGYLTEADIDTYAELNTIVADEDLAIHGDNISVFVNDAGYISRPSYVAVNDQTGTSYTALSSDLDCLIVMDNAAANTVDIDATLNSAAVIGQVIDVMQKGAGQTEITSSVVTLRAKDSGYKTEGQYDVISCAKISSTEWVVIGGAA